MLLYSDELKKIEYYKNKIIQEISSTGLYPSSSLVSKQLDKIDTYLPLFENTIVTNTFDNKDYNDKLTQLYNDLLILYQCVYNMKIVEYNNTVKDLDNKLQDLETLSNVYYNRALVETTNLFGNTIFYQGSGFIQSYNNGEITISLGSILTHENSKLAFICKVNDMGQDNIYFIINDKQISAYNYNQDLYIVPSSSPKINTYDYTLGSDTTVNLSGFAININTLIPSFSNTYCLFCSENSLYYERADGIVGGVEKQKNIAINNTTGNVSTYTCYIYGASYINLEFSREPISKNFDSNTIKNISRIQKIQFKIDSNQTFNISTDGRLFADKIDVYIKDNVLYTANYIKYNNYKYMLEEVISGKEKTIDNVKMIIKNADKAYYDITSIAIKESIGVSTL